MQKVEYFGLDTFKIQLVSQSFPTATLSQSAIVSLSLWSHHVLTSQSLTTHFLEA